MSENGKPAVGSVAPVTVQPVWQHATVVVTALIAAIPIIIATLTQLKELPGLPTNVLAWIAAAISILTTVYIVYEKVFGTPTVTPSAAYKLIQTNAGK